MAEKMREPIDDPLWDLMLSTHGCDPGCGCDADFEIDPRSIGNWIEEFGDDFARVALRQVDELLARGQAIEAAVGEQRNYLFRPPETVTAWLLRWRPAIEQALHIFLTENVPTVAIAETARAAARDALENARRRVAEFEQRAFEAFKQDPEWCAAQRVTVRAARKRSGANRAGNREDEAKWRTVFESARAVMAPIEHACRARYPEHTEATQELRAAELAFF